MNDSIENDDEKFNDLITKQHPTFESFAESVEESKDVIENDDAKLENLAYLQDITQGPPEHASLEEKYEEEIMINEVTKMLDKDFKRRLDNGEDPFAQFFREKEDEQWWTKTTSGSLNWCVNRKFTKKERSLLPNTPKGYILEVKILEIVWKTQ